MSATKVITARTPAEIAAAAREGAAAINAGKLVGFATETVYGIAARATDPAAMERLREVKSRPSRPFSVHLGRRDDAARYVAAIPPDARRLIHKAWPGPLTLLLPVGGRLAEPALDQAGLYAVLCTDDLIGLRCPQEPLAEAMLSAVADPVVAPSANPAGAPSPRSAQDVIENLAGRIDLLIDSGPCRYGQDSTIVTFAGPAWQVVRKGVLPERSIRKMLQRMVLFVCTGNTCRSPIAAGLARKLLAERLGCTVDQLKARGCEVLSAGAFATDGARASPEAIDSAARLGADISGHCSRILSKELIQTADVVFCMTATHVAEALRLAGDAGPDVRRLCDEDLPDPIGGGPDAYDRIAQQIEQALRRHVAEMDL